MLLTSPLILGWNRCTKSCFPLASAGGGGPEGRLFEISWCTAEAPPPRSLLSCSVFPMDTSVSSGRGHVYKPQTAIFFLIFVDGFGTQNFWNVLKGSFSAPLQWQLGNKWAQTEQMTVQAGVVIPTLRLKIDGKVVINLEEQRGWNLVKY